MDQDTRHFRAGVGTVIYNNEYEVAWFERASYPIGVWQFQQGGIDNNETPETTLWRELQEETGLTKDDIERVTEYPHWTIHSYPVNRTTRDDGSLSKRMGQAHRWFFLKLKAGVTIDLKKASEAEFSACTWTTFPAAIVATVRDKATVYEELHTFFDEHIATKERVK